MIPEYDRAVLTVDVPEHHLKAGDIATVVMVHGDAGYELEFVTLGGNTVAVISVRSDQVRPIHAREIPHAREFEAA
jgi:hypothetical protein